MVTIKPFKGLTYNKEKIKTLDDVMSPPYDIISENMQNELYNKHEYNFVRLILGKQYPSDSDNDNRYTRAKKLFDEWQRIGVLIDSPGEAIYPYEIEYKVKGAKKTFNGFFTLLRLDPEYKQVKAHEKTLAKPKADRLNLMRTCHANLEPIELLYMDENDHIQDMINQATDEPIISVKGYDSFKHSLWMINNEETIKKITDEFKNKILFIADGHHRYQTSINYAIEQKEKTGDNNPDASFNYIMVVLSNMYHPGLSILPTHRLVKIPGFKPESFLESMKKYFEIEENKIKTINYDKTSKKIIKSIESKKEHKFAMYHKKKYYIFTLKDESVMDEIASEHSKTWRLLDVSILHKLILEKGLGINDANLEDHIKYTKSESEAVKVVDEGLYDLSFLINPTRIEELKSIADEKEYMPQKSTYFLPKMLSGLVMYKM
ncbi:MAG: DUF1015 domain-containing protein [Candidatus Thermoplasmatota archaeon]